MKCLEKLQIWTSQITTLCPPPCPFTLHYHHKTTTTVSYALMQYPHDNTCNILTIIPLLQGLPPLYLRHAMVQYLDKTTTTVSYNTYRHESHENTHLEISGEAPDVGPLEEQHRFRPPDHARHNTLTKLPRPRVRLSYNLQAITSREYPS